MVAGCQRSPTDARRLRHFKRHGVDHICGYPADEEDPASWTADGLARLRDLCASHGVSLDMVQFPTLSSAAIERSTRKAINIHFRNIRGRRDAFQEVFPDEGDLDMVAALRTLKDVGYSYMVMPDHMPRHDDDPDQDQAFAFGYGYIKALIQAVG
jgi:D-mannonate dehydratase